MLVGDVTEQSSTELGARSQEPFDWLNLANGSFHKIVNDWILTFRGRYILCTGYLLS